MNRYEARLPFRRESTDPYQTLRQAEAVNAGSSSARADAPPPQSSDTLAFLMTSAKRADSLWMNAPSCSRVAGNSS